MENKNRYNTTQKIKRKKFKIKLLDGFCKIIVSDRFVLGYQGCLMSSIRMTTTVINLCQHISFGNSFQFDFLSFDRWQNAKGRIKKTCS